MSDSSGELWLRLCHKDGLSGESGVVSAVKLYGNYKNHLELRLLLATVETITVGLGHWKQLFLCFVKYLCRNVL